MQVFSLLVQRLISLDLACSLFAILRQANQSITGENLRTTGEQVVKSVGIHNNYDDC